jgi:hypothetical protein
MTLFQQIAAALNWNLRVNENFDSVSPAGLYGRNPATTTGLTWGFLGGNFNGVAVTSGTVALTASNTNYVVAHRTTGAVTAAITTTNWLNTSTYLQLYQIVAGASTVTSYDDMRQAFGGTGGSGSFTGGTLISALNEAPPVTIASASTVNIGAAAANTVLVSGTTTITAFDTIAAGAIRRVRFLGALTLTYSGTSLILPGASNITTAAGDVATMESLGSGNWRCVDYAKADGTALVGGGGGGSGTVTSVDASGGVETTSGSAITASGTIRGAVSPNAQIATTYTVVTGDRGKLVTFSNPSAIAVTLPQAISNFGSGWYFFAKNLGAGTVTITPTTSTIGGGATLVLTTGQMAMIVSDGTNYQTMFTAGSGSGLTNWTEAVNSSAPNATIPVVSFTVSNAATNVDAAIAPKGTGALVAAPSSGSINKRGSNAVDFQMSRSGGTMVASGNWATLVGGNNNTASGTECFSGGGTTNANSGAQGVLVGGSTNTLSATQGVVCGGNTNNSSADYGVIGGGFGNLASGIHSCIPGGRQATTRGITGALAHASGRFGTTGDAQAARYVLRRQTTNATTTPLSSDNAVSAAANSIVLPNNSVYVFEVLITAKVTTFGDRATYKITGQVSRNASAAATAIDGTPTVTTITAIGGASAWTVAAVANTTLGSLEIQVTGAAATNINWVARVETVENTA